MRPRILILVPLAAMFIGTWAEDAAPARGDPGARARGDNFSFPVPKGFSVPTDERLTRHAPGGVVLVADRRAGAGMFLGSVVVTRLSPGANFNPGDPVFCKQVAEAGSVQMGAALKAHRTFRTPAGNTCQWEVVDKELSTRGATATIMYKTRDNCWLVTCNFDNRDARARAACGEVLEGWAFH